MKDPMENDLWEDHEWGGKNHEGLLIAAEYERTEEISGGQGYRGELLKRPGKDAGGRAMKNKKKRKTLPTKCTLSESNKQWSNRRKMQSIIKLRY